MPWRDFNDVTDQVKLDDSHMIHFDLKPNNILFGGLVNSYAADPTDRYPTVKVADFGLAEIKPQDYARPYKTYGNLGTPGFIPPVSTSD